MTAPKHTRFDWKGKRRPVDKKKNVDIASNRGATELLLMRTIPGLDVLYSFSSVAT